MPWFYGTKCQSYFSMWPFHTRPLYLGRDVALGYMIPEGLKAHNIDRRPEEDAATQLWVPCVKLHMGAQETDQE